MAFESKATFGIFRKDSDVSAAKDKLRAKGFLISNISILYPMKKSQHDIQQLQKTMIVPFAKIGALIGCGIFLIVGICINTGIIPMPALPLKMTFMFQTLALLFTIILGTLFGAASGALIGIGTPQITSKRFGNYLGSGGILMSVHVNNINEERWAHTALEKSGAQDITILNEGQGWESVYENMI
jgi:hypothetical protein